MSDAVSEIKSRLNIEDVVSEYVQLKRAGRNFKGLSPFTNEKTPSFIVSPEKQIWHDFSSGKGGDVISFIEVVEGVDFKGSLEILARKAGVDLSQYQSSSSTNSKAKERLYKAVSEAVSFYQIQLTKHTTPLKYLRQKRGYEKQTLLDFKFGYSPKTGDALISHLMSNGFTEQELRSCGLLVSRRGKSGDMFVDRIMVPLSDAQGRPVGFTARQLTENKNAPKYINTPATMLYDKSRQLFGFSLAKEHIRKSGFVVVVEGNLDVVASHQAGVGQVVASAGTALTVHHLKSLQRFTGDIRLAFDEDRAGQEAAERTIPIAQELGLELSMVSIPSGKDPDELISEDVSLWEKTIAEPVYMIDWLIERYASQVDLTTAQGKRSFTTKIFSVLKKVQDQVEREHYMRIIADKTNTSVQSLDKKFADDDTKQTKRLKKPKISADEQQNNAELLTAEQHFLAIMLEVPEMRPMLEHIPADLYSDQANDLRTSSAGFENVKKTDEYAKMLALLFEETYQHTAHDELGYQAEKLARRLVDVYTRQQKQQILTKLETAEQDDETALLRQVRELEQQKLSIFENLQTNE